MQNTQDRNRDLNLLRDKLSRIKVAMLTTIDPDGAMRSRPMGAQEIDSEGRLWFFTNDESPKADSIDHEQRVNVAFSDEHHGLWVSISGHAKIVHDREKMKELWSPMLKTWFPKGVDDPKISLICIDLESAQIWDTPLNKMNLVLSMAKAFKKGEAMNPEGNSQKIDLHH